MTELRTRVSPTIADLKGGERFTADDLNLRNVYVVLAMKLSRHGLRVLFIQRPGATRQEAVHVHPDHPITITSAGATR